MERPEIQKSHSELSSIFSYFEINFEMNFKSNIHFEINLNPEMNFENDFEIICIVNFKLNLDVWLSDCHLHRQVHTNNKANRWAIKFASYTTFETCNKCAWNSICMKFSALFDYLPEMSTPYTLIFKRFFQPPSLPPLIMKRTESVGQQLIPLDLLWLNNTTSALFC